MPRGEVTMLSSRERGKSGICACTACERGRMGTQINVSGRYNRLLKQLADRVRAMVTCRDVR